MDMVNTIDQRELVRKISYIHSDLIKERVIDKYVDFLFKINKKIDELSKLTHKRNNFHEVSQMIDFYFQGESFGYYVASRVPQTCPILRRARN